MPDGMRATGAALPGTYETVCGLLRHLPQGLILDAPCGEGHLSAALAGAGYRVVAGDLRYAHVGTRDLPIVGLDLNDALPFRDEAFDAATVIEGVEHLENPSALLRELARVLRPKGTLIVTTPNVVNLRSRLKFLLFGVLYWFDVPGYQRGGHVHPLPVYELCYALKEAGFAVDRVCVNRRPLGMRAVTVLLGGLLRFTAARWGVPRELNGADLLAGEVLVVAATKDQSRSGGRR